MAGTETEASRAGAFFVIGLDCKVTHCNGMVHGWGVCSTACFGENRENKECCEKSG